MTANRHGQWPLHCVLEPQTTVIANIEEDATELDSTLLLPPILTLAVVQQLCHPIQTDDSRRRDGVEDSDDYDEETEINASVHATPFNETLCCRDSIASPSPLLDIPALSHCDSFGDCPLHIVCRRLSSVTVETVAWLLARNASVARVCNHQGHLPLHLAAMCTTVGADNTRRQRPGCHVIQSIRLLLAANPEAVVQPDNEGDTPLHCALTCPNVSLDVLNCLCNASADQISVKLGCQRIILNQMTGQTPLHTACANRVFDHAVLDTLISFDPSALWRHDANGHLPVHEALSITYPNQSVCPISILHKLLYCNENELNRLDAVPICGSFSQSQSSCTTTLPCTRLGDPALFLACEGAAVIITPHCHLDSLGVIRFLVEQSPELFSQSRQPTGK